MSNLLVQNIKHTNGTTAQTIDSGGFTIPRVPCFRAYPSANQTISSSYTYTKLNMNTEDFDVGGYYDTSNYRYTPLVAGIYYIQVGVGLTSTNAIVGVIFKNGSIYQNGGIMQNAGYTLNTSITTGLVSMNGSSDYIEAFGNSSSTSQVVSGNSIYTNFSAVLVGASS
tara:strand:+ start:265 stop:768 length:504 start_codon:yes stop_codon:yes gene_type:complete